MENRTFRCSSLPRIWLCPASGHVPDDYIQTKGSGPLSEMGSAVHAVTADVVRRGLKAIPELDPYIGEYGIKDAEELNWLSWNTCGLWWEIKDALTVIAVEESFDELFAPGIRLRGTGDVVAKSRHFLVVVDWKSGYRQDDPRHQLRGYLWSFMQRFPEIHEAKIIVGWSRTRELETFNVRRSELEEWAEEMRERFAQDHFNPGEYQCMYCQRKRGCPAYKQYINESAKALLPAMRPDSELTPQQVVDLWPQRCLLSKALKEYDSAVKMLLIDQGEMPLPDGYVLSYPEKETESLDFAAGYKTIAKQLGLEPGQNKLIETLGANVTVTKTNYLNMIQDRTQKGKTKKAAKEEAWEKLREAGAVVTKVSRTITKKKGTA